MNIKKVMVQVAMVIQERDANVYNMVIRDNKDKTKPSSIKLNEVVILSFVEAEDVPTYVVKFMGEEVHRDSSLTGSIEVTIDYAQKYVDNKAYYNKIRNSI